MYDLLTMLNKSFLVSIPTRHLHLHQFLSVFRFIIHFNVDLEIKFYQMNGDYCDRS